ncbi:MAG: PEP-CTERM sorting domain-containing protein [Bryobacterales bacterium]|nr:PEP-CTERM sorting domain-containing protein [Bryobacterales bacterium]
MKRYSLPFALFACTFAFSGQAVAGIVLGCPDTLYMPGPVAGLGNAQSCGETITTGPTSVDIMVDPFGTYAYAGDLESWLGLDPFDLDLLLGPFDGIYADGGAAIWFPSFTANAGDTLEFDWSGSFESGATGYLFYQLDNSFHVLDYQIGNVSLPTIGMLTIAQSISEPLSAGNHSLAFGVVVGYPAGQILMEKVILDPTLNISNLQVSSSVPEPGSVALLCGGLLALVTLRRKRNL